MARGWLKPGPIENPTKPALPQAIATGYRCPIPLIEPGADPQVNGDPAFPEMMDTRVKPAYDELNALAATIISRGNGAAFSNRHHRA